MLNIACNSKAYATHYSVVTNTVHCGLTVSGISSGYIAAASARSALGGVLAIKFASSERLIAVLKTVRLKNCSNNQKLTRKLDTEQGS